MPNIKATMDNLWVEYYDDDTEENGFFINNVYVGSDPLRTNIVTGKQIGRAHV